MSITPKSPAISQQGWVQTWVTSRWKNPSIPGQFSAEINMPGIVVREIERPIAVADDEQLKEAQDCLRVAVPRIVLVLDDLLHGASRAYTKGFYE
jgi:hypothetical protein